jgi:flotillin
VAEAVAQLEVQKARIDQVRQQLQADIIAPASAQMEAAINRARGEAAKIVEEGRATAEVLRQITGAWKQAGPNARDVFLMQKLNSLVETLTNTIDGVKVDKVTVLGMGNGSSQDLAAKVIGANEQIKAALGVDVVSALQGTLAQAGTNAATASAATSSPSEASTQPSNVARPAAAQPKAPKPAPAPAVRPSFKPPKGSPARANR